MNAVTYSPVQQEAIVLAATLDMIDGMVNRAIFTAPRTDRPTNLLFQSSADRRLFTILLGDFLALPQGRGKDPPPFGLAPAGEDEKGSAKTYLRYLRDIAATPRLASDATGLGGVVADFASWLDCKLTERVWLSDLELDFDMTVPRIWVFRTAADLAKHNFSRLAGQVRLIHRMLVEHGREIDEALIYMALPNVEEWLGEHLLVYHASTLAEFLNNIRLAIYTYLRPEFLRSFRRQEDTLYTFDVPTEIGGGLPRAMYWRLMNALRGPPIFPVFAVHDSHKLRY